MNKNTSSIKINLTQQDLQISIITSSIYSRLYDLMISVINGQYFGRLPAPAVLFLVKGANRNARNDVPIHEIVGLNHSIFNKYIAFFCESQACIITLIGSLNFITRDVGGSSSVFYKLQHCILLCHLDLHSEYK